MTLAVKWGYKPTPKDHHRPMFAMMRAGTVQLDTIAAEVLPPVVDQSPLAPLTMDQGPYGSCVGHARSGVVTLALAATGTPLPWVVSPDVVYRLARCVERAGTTPRNRTLPALVDEGAFPSMAHVAISEWGVVGIGPLVDGRYSDCGANVNDEPDFGTLEWCSQTLIVGEYAITGTPAARGLATRQALAHGFPVECGSFVDTRYMEWSDPDAAYGKPDYFDADGGGHDQYILGYREVQPGVYWYDVQNSWGSAWCRNGRIWVTDEFLGQCDDLNAIAARRA